MCKLYAAIGPRREQYKQKQYHYKYIKLKTDQHLLQRLVAWYVKRSADLIMIKKDELSPSFRKLFVFLKIVKFFIISSADREIFFTVSTNLDTYTFSATHHTSFLTIDNCNSTYSIKI